MKQNPLVQIAIDVMSVSEALSLAEDALACGADWIEIGKPLVEFEGIKGVRSLCESLPACYFVLDLMIIAGPEKYIRAAKEIGAHNVTVSALAPEHTIKSAIDAGRSSGVEVTVDLFNAGDLVERSKSYEAMGAHYLMVHFGVDQKTLHPSHSPIVDLEEVVEAVTIPVAYATYDVYESVSAVRAGASIIVQGEPLLSDPDYSSKLAAFIDQTKSTAKGV